MPAIDEAASLEEQIDQWRSYFQRRRVMDAPDIAELEDHLREQIAGLSRIGLTPDEAFFVAVKRLGDLDSVSREFAREHSDRLWKQLVVSPAGASAPQSEARTEAIVAFALASAAAVAIKLPALFGIQLVSNFGFYERNASFFVLPLLTSYFAWKRRLPLRAVQWLVGAFLVAAIFANAYPLTPRGATEALIALHLPIAMWLAIGIAYTGNRWRECGARMDFVRFSGELFIYFVLIALGGGALSAFMAMIFQTAGVDVDPFFRSWLLPCGAVGAIIIASWLVEAKQSVIENMAPVLARLFTPLFAAVLIAFLGTVILTGHGINVERNVLIAFDLLLVMVLGLLLYSVSARDLHERPSLYDLLQVALVVSALLADAIALWAMALRINAFGPSPNRVAALGENLILLVNLAWSAVLYVRVLQSKGSMDEIERWQTNYLPIYAAWAAVVVIIFPPAFAFV